MRNFQPLGRAAAEWRCVKQRRFLLRATPESIDVNSSREKCLLKTKKKGVWVGVVGGGYFYIAPPDRRGGQPDSGGVA